MGLLKIGHFLIDEEKVLGFGNFAKVYEATDENTGKLVAAKKVDLQQFHPLQRPLALREIDVLKRIPPHPNVVGFIEHVTEGNVLWLFMEKCIGMNLDDYCEKHSLRLLDKYDMMISITEALCFVHTLDNPVVHRDLKGENILICTDQVKPVPKVTDFGTAKIVEIQGELTSYAGTLRYMAPELHHVKRHLRDEDAHITYDEKVDVFSIALLFYDFRHADCRKLQPLMALGQAMYESVGRMKPPIVISHADSLEERKFKELILAMLDYNPKLRLTMRDVLTSLRNIKAILERLINEASVIEKLNLGPYVQNKLTYHDVLNVTFFDEEVIPSWKNVSKTILRHLLSANHEARDKYIADLSSSKMSVKEKRAALRVKRQTSSLSTGLHPLDAFLAMYQCCDDNLKQLLVTKMFQARLAIPIFVQAGGDLIFSLWPLLNLTISWRIMAKSKGSPETSQVVSNSISKSAYLIDHPIPIISFVRAGRPLFSKSQLLNEILFNSKPHAFCNRESPNGMNQHNLASGYVEGCCFLPSGMKSDLFEKELLFLNLRDNYFDTINTAKVLMTISFVMVILMDAEDFTDSSFVKTLIAHQVIFVLTSANDGMIDLLEETLDSYGDQLDVVPAYLEHVNMSEIKEMVVEIIREKLAKVTRLHSLREHSMNLEYPCDEPFKTFCQHRQTVKAALDLPAGSLLADYKKKVFPLQGQTWETWSNLQKELYRKLKPSQNISLAAFAEEVESKMDRERSLQYQLTQHPCKQVEFLCAMMKSDAKERSYILHGIRNHFDNLTQEMMPSIHNEYVKLWGSYSSLRRSTRLDDSIGKKMTDLDMTMVKSSLGVEHVFRELAQIYEAIESKGSADATEKWKYLPKEVAHLIVEGHPFEIMDGAVASVPLCWTKALLKSLSDTLGSDKTIFVLSVIGIQSSGKSTLLNTMFGTEFNVSAGRCTRGIFAQLFPITNKEKLNFDYLLLLDTEGLRAPEQKEEMFHHDNELATLIIGLADLTLVNMKGENTVEMKHVLQIVTHAFLRMKGADNLKHQECIFVHQNVSAVDAGEKMLKALKGFTDELDEITREIAEMESIPNILSFAQIMDFNGTSDVVYLSDCWSGEPPMAPMNPRYCDTVLQLKKQILFKAKQRSSSLNVLDDIADRVEDLWKAILSEDFVFNFSNSKTLKAYLFVESKCSEERIYGMQKLDDETRRMINNIMTCNTNDHVKKQLAEAMQKLASLVPNIADEVNTNIGAYIENHKYKDYMIGYLDHKQKEVRQALELHQSGLEEKLQKASTDRHEVLKHMGQRKMNEKAIKMQADGLISYLMANSVTSTIEITEEFNNRWLSWVDHEQEECDLQTLMTTMELSMLAKLATEGVKAADCIPFFRGQRKLPPKLSENLIAANIDTAFFEQTKSFFSYNSTKTCKKEVAERTSVLLLSLDSHLKRRHKAPMKSNDLNQLVLDVYSKFKSDLLKSKNDQKKYVLTKYWKAAFCCHAVYCIILQLTEGRSSSIPEWRMGQILRDIEKSLLTTFVRNTKDLKPLLTAGNWWRTESLPDLPSLVQEADILSEDSSSHKQKKRHVAEAIKNVMKVIDTQLNKICDRESPFLPTYASEFALIMMKSFEEHNDNSKVKLSPSCVARFAVKSAALANSKFEAMDMTYKIKCGLLSQLEQFREQTELYVRSEMTKTHLPKTAARITSTVLGKAIQRIVPQNIERPIINSIHRAIGFTKQDIIVSIMTELATNCQQKTPRSEVFTQFCEYIYNPCDFATRWLKRKSDLMLFRWQDKIYLKLATKQIQDIISSSVQSISQDEKSTNSRDWCERFCKSMGNMLPGLSVDEFMMLTSMEELDINYFKRFLLDSMEGLKIFLIEAFSKVDETSVIWNGKAPYTQIMDSLWGCKAHCPFCREPCRKTMANHLDQHECIEHRPHVVCGWHDFHGPTMSNCELLVATEGPIYHCGNTGCNCGVKSLMQYHMYSEYKTFLPKWHIPSDPRYESSKYWKWFIHTFREQLKEKYELDDIPIPDMWTKISYDMAQKSLERYKRKVIS